MKGEGRKLDREGQSIYRTDRRWVIEVSSSSKERNEKDQPING